MDEFPNAFSKFEPLRASSRAPEPRQGPLEAPSAIPEPTNSGKVWRYSHRDGCACRACRTAVRLKPATFEAKVKFFIVMCAVVGLLGLVLWAALASRV